MMKKILSVMLSATMVMTALAGCGLSGGTTETAAPAQTETKTEEAKSEAM